MLGVAAWTIAAREMFGAVVGYVAYGLLLAIVWVRLYAPDVALTEAAIGGGVTGVLLVVASKRLGRLPQTDRARRRGAEGRRRRALRPRRGRRSRRPSCTCPIPLPRSRRRRTRHLAATGLGNPVTAVLIAYRSFDTMLEKVVLVLAVVGVWSVAPDRFWGGAPAPLGPAGPDAALVFLARVLAPIGLVIGVQMFWVGADEPGGAFQGGAILAAMWMIVMMARLTEPPRIDSAPPPARADLRGRPCSSSRGSPGLFMAGSFFAYPAGFAKPVILFIEAFMVLSIAVTLPLLVAGPPNREGGRLSALGHRRLRRRRARRARPLRAHRRSAAAEEAARLQPDRQRRVPRLRHRRAARRGRPLSVRSRAPGDGDHWHRRRFRGERARGRADAPPRRGVR